MEGIRPVRCFPKPCTCRTKAHGARCCWPSNSPSHFLAEQARDMHSSPYISKTLGFRARKTKVSRATTNGRRIFGSIAVSAVGAGSTLPQLKVAIRVVQVFATFAPLSHTLP